MLRPDVFRRFVKNNGMVKTTLAFTIIALAVSVLVTAAAMRLYGGIDGRVSGSGLPVA